MKVFHCSHCQHLVFFENAKCVRCGHTLAFLPDSRIIGSLDSLGADLWSSPISGETQRYRLCENYVRENICNWAIVESDTHALCESCRLTRFSPDLTRTEFKGAWFKLEAAKRRLLYTLGRLGCSVRSAAEEAGGIAFEFLADSGKEGVPRVLSGHVNGVITINLAEADDAERERRRLELHEPYRTLLGHFRHESGHYYWDLLIKDSPSLDAFRALFGDERTDYGRALQDHYNQGPPPDWQQHYVTAYATSHPWEDWAETWAHYLHMIDTLETAMACGLSLQPARPDEPALKAVPAAATHIKSFDDLNDRWFPLTYILNNLNRGLGLPDGYPFVLSTPAIEKIRFVHQAIHGMRSVKDEVRPAA
jgi:hypothetical protein